MNDWPDKELNPLINYWTNHLSTSFSCEIVIVTSSRRGNYERNHPCMVQKKHLFIEINVILHEVLINHKLLYSVFPSHLEIVSADSVHLLPCSEAKVASVSAPTFINLPEHNGCHSHA